MSWVAAGVAVGSAALSVGGTMLANSQNKSGSGGFGKYKSVPQINYNPQQVGLDLQAVYPYLEGAARQATAYQTEEREKIMPGSQNQFNLASSALQSFLGGTVPPDVQAKINRQVAERTGGGFNPTTGGGQAQSDYARNLGLTSLNLQQMGLQSAPTWLQLADSFVVKPFKDVAPTALGLAQNRYAYDALNSGIALQNAVSDYQAQANNAQLGMVQGQIGNAQTQSLLNTGLGALQAGADIYGKYRSSVSPVISNKVPQYNREITFPSSNTYKGKPLLGNYSTGVT